VGPFLRLGLGSLATLAMAFGLGLDELLLEGV
jgi:hypothetical protein